MPHNLQDRMIRSIMNALIVEQLSPGNDRSQQHELDNLRELIYKIDYYLIALKGNTHTVYIQIFSGSYCKKVILLEDNSLLSQN